MRFMRPTKLVSSLLYLDFVADINYKRCMVTADPFSEVRYEKGIQNSAFPMAFVKNCGLLLSDESLFFVLPLTTKAFMQ